MDNNGFQINSFTQRIIFKIIIIIFVLRLVLMSLRMASNLLYNKGWPWAPGHLWGLACAQNVWFTHVLGGLKRESDSLELELQTVVWVWRTDPRSSGRTTRALDTWATTSSSRNEFLSEMLSLICTVIECWFVCPGLRDLLKDLVNELMIT